MVDSHVPMAKDALRRLIDKRLQAGPVYRQGAKYLGQNDAPHTITHPRTPLKVTDPAFLDWLADERWFWEGEMLGAYQIDAFSCEVVDK